MNWLVIDTDDEGVHVVPEDDTFEHTFCNCKCDPEFDEDARCTVHNSFDGREDFESGKRLFS
jgi:hypothetical protein